MYFKLDTTLLITSEEAKAEYGRLCEQYVKARTALYDFIDRMTTSEVVPSREKD